MLSDPATEVHLSSPAPHGAHRLSLSLNQPGQVVLHTLQRVLQVCLAVEWLQGCTVWSSVWWDGSTPSSETPPTTAQHLALNRCVAEKGEESTDCAYHKRFYRSICPDEWVRNAPRTQARDMYASCRWKSGRSCAQRTTGLASTRCFTHSCVVVGNADNVTAAHHWTHASKSNHHKNNHQR